MQLDNRWMMNGEHEVTAAGNPKPPTPEVYLDWILEAWNDGVTKDNIVSSFKTCGITTALDGSENHLVHCLKDGNGMPNGCYKLAQKREEAEEAHLSELMAGWTSMKTTSATSVMLKSSTIRARKGTIT